MSSSERGGATRSTHGVCAPLHAAVVGVVERLDHVVVNEHAAGGAKRQNPSLKRRQGWKEQTMPPQASPRDTTQLMESKQPETQNGGLCSLRRVSSCSAPVAAAADEGAGLLLNTEGTGKVGVLIGELSADTEERPEAGRRVLSLVQHSRKAECCCVAKL